MSTPPAGPPTDPSGRPDPYGPPDPSGRPDPGVARPDPYGPPDPGAARPGEASPDPGVDVPPAPGPPVPDAYPPPAPGAYPPPDPGQQVPQAPGPYGPPPGQGPGAQPYGARPDSAQPYGAQPYGAQPDAAQPDAAQPYGAQPYGGPVDVWPVTDERPLDGVSVAGLVLAFLVAPLGLVLSIVGIARTAGGRRRGRGLAIAGVIVSVIATLLLAGLIVALVALGNFFVDNPELFEEGQVAPGAELDLGETAAVGDLDVTVTEVELDGAATMAELGSDTSPTGQFVLVSADVTNTSAEDVEVYFAVYAGYESAAGAEYDESTCAATFEGQAASLPLLEPGGETEVSWCFDVPVVEVGDGRVVMSADSILSEPEAVWRDE